MKKAFILLLKTNWKIVCIPAIFTFLFLFSAVDSKACKTKIKYNQNDSIITYFDSSDFTPTGWFWDFGDGFTSTQPSPTHTYAVNQGTYNVMLIASKAGCSDTAFLLIDLGLGTNVCDANFTYSKNSLLNYSFNNISQGNGLTYKWNFGDGSSISTQKNPVHNFPKPGIYYVCLSVINNKSSCTDTHCVRLAVVDTNVCKPSFTYDRTGKTVKFYNTSKGDSTKLFWDFGDGQTSTKTSPTHTYDNTGNFFVCLLINDSLNGCYERICRNIPVFFPDYSISGTVSTTQSIAENVKVYVYPYNPSPAFAAAIDSVDNDSLGFYIFPNLPLGAYRLKASFKPSVPGFNLFAPAWHKNKIKWTEAITVNNPAGNVNITLPLLENPGGTGSISGFVTEYEQGNPVPDIQVLLLTQAGTPVAHTKTGFTGEFHFANLEMNNYQVYADVAGLATFPPSVTLTGTEPDADSVNIIIFANSVRSSVEKNRLANVRNLRIFPNPSNEKAFITVNPDELTKVSVYNILGELVYSDDHKAASGILEIPVTHIPAGFYSVKAESPKEIYSGKLLIRR